MPLRLHASPIPPLPPPLLPQEHAARRAACFGRLLHHAISLTEHSGRLCKLVATRATSYVPASSRLKRLITGVTGSASMDTFFALRYTESLLCTYMLHYPEAQLQSVLPHLWDRGLRFEGGEEGGQRPGDSGLLMLEPGSRLSNTEVSFYVGVWLAPLWVAGLEQLASLMDMFGKALDDVEGSWHAMEDAAEELDALDARLLARPGLPRPGMRAALQQRLPALHRPHAAVDDGPGQGGRREQGDARLPGVHHGPAQRRRRPAAGV
jgi:hypothetical protein